MSNFLSEFQMQGGESHGSLSDMTCSESASSFQSVSQSSTPEILIGLVYNATTGRLSVEIIKGIHFKNLAANKPPSKYSKWFLFHFYETNEPHQKLSLCIGFNLLSYGFHFKVYSTHANLIVGGLNFSLKPVEKL